MWCFPNSLGEVAKVWRMTHFQDCEKVFHSSALSGHDILAAVLLRIKKLVVLQGVWESELR